MITAVFTDQIKLVQEIAEAAQRASDLIVSLDDPNTTVNFAIKGDQVFYKMDEPQRKLRLAAFLMTELELLQGQLKKEAQGQLKKEAETLGELL